MYLAFPNYICLFTLLRFGCSGSAPKLPIKSWLAFGFWCEAVRQYKLDGGETSGADGPTFVLRHRTSNVIEASTNCTSSHPMSPRDKEETPTSGSSTSHLSAAESPAHNGVSVWHSCACLVGHRIKESSSNAYHRVNYVNGVNIRTETDTGSSGGLITIAAYSNLLNKISI